MNTFNQLATLRLLQSIPLCEGNTCLKVLRKEDNLALAMMISEALASEQTEEIVSRYAYLEMFSKKLHIAVDWDNLPESESNWLEMYKRSNAYPIRKDLTIQELNRMCQAAGIRNAITKNP